MKPLLCLLFACAAAGALAPAPASAAGFEGRRCTPPSGHRIADCRVGRHGIPDLSRAAWRALRGAEVTISVKIDTIAPNPAAGGVRSWPLVDSLAQPMGRLETRADGRGLVLRAFDGRLHRVTSVRMRGRGCAASLDQQRRFAVSDHRQVALGRRPGLLRQRCARPGDAVRPRCARRVHGPARRRDRLRSQRP